MPGLKPHSSLASGQMPWLTPRSLTAGLAVPTAVLRNSKVFNRTLSLSLWILSTRRCWRLLSPLSQSKINTFQFPLATCLRNTDTPSPEGLLGSVYSPRTSRINDTNCDKQAVSYTADLRRSPPVSTVRWNISRRWNKDSLESVAPILLDSNLVLGICDSLLLWISGILWAYNPSRLHGALATSHTVAYSSVKKPNLLHSIVVSES